VTDSKINENSLDRLHNQSPGVHNMSRTMNKNDSEFVINTVICEAVGCFSKAAIKLPVRVGTAGTIALFLCEECKSKFMTESDEDEVDLTR
jgi:hypothetical protein